MKVPTSLFEKSPILGGYTLSVKDDWSYKLKKVYLSEEDKEKYLETFGDQLITYDTFFEWYKELKNK